MKYMNLTPQELRKAANLPKYLPYKSKSRLKFVVGTVSSYEIDIKLGNSLIGWLAVQSVQKPMINREFRYDPFVKFYAYFSGLAKDDRVFKFKNGTLDLSEIEQEIVNILKSYGVFDRRL